MTIGLFGVRFWLLWLVQSIAGDSFMSKLLGCLNAILTAIAPSFVAAADLSATAFFEVQHPTGSAKQNCVITWKQTKTAPDFYVGTSKDFAKEIPQPAPLPPIPAVMLKVTASSMQVVRGVPTMTISVSHWGTGGAFNAVYTSTALTGSDYTLQRGDPCVVWPSKITPTAVVVP